MKPVWIKYYGLIPMTRTGYLIALNAAAGIVLLIVLMAALAGLLPPVDTMWSAQHHRPGRDVGAWFYNYLYWILVVCLVAQGIDTLCTLRVFARKEAEQRAERARLEEEWARLGEERRVEPETRVRDSEGGRRPAP
jgi:hypothetical protein